MLIGQLLIGRNRGTFCWHGLGRMIGHLRSGRNRGTSCWHGLGTRNALKRWAESAVGEPGNFQHHRQTWIVSLSPREVAARAISMPEAEHLIPKHVEKHGRIRPELKTASYLRVGTFAEDVFTAENATPQ